MMKKVFMSPFCMLLRKIFFSLSIFILGAILGKPLALESFGLLVKGILYFDRGWNFFYDALDWEKGRILFLNARIEDRGKFFLDCSSLSLDWKQKYLELKKPQLKILDFPKFGKKSDWAVSMQGGEIDLDGSKRVQFSFEKILPKMP